MLISLAALISSPALLTVTPLADIYVDAAAVNCVTGTGTLTDPVCSISDAVALASPGDTIRIEPGTYFESVTLPFDLDLIGTNGADLTIVDGGFVGRVLTIPSTVTTNVEGVTLRHGRAEEGAGVLCLGNLTISNSVVTNNLAYVSTTGFGAVRGGGILVDGGVLTLETSTVSRNQAAGGLTRSGLGGGILIDSGTALLRNSTISENGGHSIYDSANGGGVLVESGVLTIEECTVTGNVMGVQLGSSFGGGLYSRLSTTNILNTTISENEVNFGGGVWAFGGTLNITGSTVSSNKALNNGGGLELSNLQFDLRNSTVSGNIAQRSAGVLISEPLAGSRLANSTVTFNTAFQWNGGVSSGGMGAPIEVLNCIIAQNFMLQQSGPFELTTNVHGAFNSLGHNLVDLGDALFVDGVNGDQIGSPISPIDSLLGPLQGNGGSTWTHQPLPGSPAINGGDPIVFEAVDQRGQSRPLGSSSEIGSVESEGAFNGVCLGNGGVQAGCTNCPCGNDAPVATSGGCLNSAGTAAVLGAAGDPSVSLAPNSITDLSFSLQGAPPVAFCVLNSGDAVAPASAANPCFGLDSGVQAVVFDGLRCAVNNTRRHGGRVADFAGSVGIVTVGWGGGSAPAVGIASAGGGFIAGQTRFFQVINRDDPLAQCMRGLNTSQAVEVTFTP